jgi:T5SS/PEP-CTERM-associated repeat protein
MKIRSLLRALVPALLFVATLQRSTAQDTPATDWANYGSLGDWFVDTNWTNGVPNSTTDAHIRDSGFALINAPSASAHDLYVGLTINGLVGDGTLQVSQAGSATPGSLTAGNIYVGSQDPYTATFSKSTGTLVVQKGATVASSAELFIGSGYESTGTVTVQDLNSGLTIGDGMTVGNGPNCIGTLNIQNGARVGCSFAQIGAGNILTPMNGELSPNGSMTVTGAGSQLAVHGLNIGYAGQGTVVVSSGGTVVDSSNNFGGSADSTIAAYAGYPNSALTVTDSGSSWSTPGSIDVGGYDRAGGQPSSNGGIGILRVQSGGLVQCSRLNAFANCEVTVDNGSSLTAGLRLSGGTGVMATGATPGDITIGRNSAGRMEVRGGGTAWSDRGFLGLNSGTSGSALVTDAGSKWSNSSLYVGLSGDGTLDVLNGGVVTGGSDSFIGFTANTVGNATVSGAGSSWSLTGNLYIAGSATQAGGTGTLQLENGGALTATSATVYNNGYLNLSANPVLNAPLTFLGGGIQFVTSDNTSFPNDFTIGAGGVRVYTYGHPSVLGGSITGPGGLTKGGGAQLGLGTLTLTGTSNYAGPTALNTGKLVVNGSITSAVTVNNAATLGGNGAVGSVTVNSGGIMDPGNSPGKLTINGNYTQNSGGILNIEIGGASPGPGGYDQLAVSGTATLGGTLNLTLVNGFRPSVGDTFNIITSSSEMGSFSNVNGSGFTVSSSSSGSGIKLTVTSVQQGAPIISSPASANGSQDQPFSYQITATDSPTSFGASGLPPGLSVNNITGVISGAPSEAGSFNATISATNAKGTGLAQLALTISVAAPSPSPLGNISTRGFVQTGDNVLIGGFTIAGTGNKTVLLRAIGPTLSNPPFNLSNTLQDPMLRVFNSSGTVIATNDNWADAPNAQSIDPTLRPGSSAESAILISLAPGAYTAIVNGANGGTGIGLVEVFDLDTVATSKLTNISTRGLVETGDSVMIGGFNIKGAANETVVIRAIGPSLANAPFNIANPLQNPTLSLFNDQGTRIQFNDDWQSDQRDDIIATGLQPSNDAESVIVTTLPPGNYTAIVNGANGTTGVALVEAYAAN